LISNLKRVWFGVNEAVLGGSTILVNDGKQGRNMSKGNWSIDGDEFQILINHEEQYSIWPSAQPVPEGWRQIGPVGGKEQCLAHIEENWTDMRPKSLRERMSVNHTEAANDDR